MENFDLAIHLAGEQSIPNLLGIRNIPAKKHLLFTSGRTSFTLKRLKRCLPNIDLTELKISDAFDLLKVIETVANGVGSEPGRVAVNLTGGTKPMSLGAWMGASETASKPTFFYFDTAGDRCLHWSEGEMIQTEPIEKSLTIDDFINLSDFDIQRQGVDKKGVEARYTLTKKIWDNLFLYTTSGNSIQSAAQKSLEAGRTDFKKTKIDKNNPNKNISINYEKNRVQSLKINGREYASSDVPLDLEYLAGRWFEEFIYWTLKPLEEQGKIREMRLGMKVMFDRNDKNPAQEFDLLVTDGLRLFVLECKAGVIKQANLDKLENITEKFAGIQGLGILVALWYQNPKKDYSKPTIERTEKSRNYACIHGNAVKDLKEKFFQLKPGVIIPAVGK